MAPRKSPKDSVCAHCGKMFTTGGLKQHLRHVKCAPTSTASPRQFERVRCKHCGKSFHSTNSLRVHVSTRHPKEYSKSPGHMKYHRSPYKKKRSDSSSAGPGPRSPAKASMSADGHPDSVRQPSGEKRRDSRRRKAESGGRDRDLEKRKPREPLEPSWQREMKKKFAEAARSK